VILEYEPFSRANNLLTDSNKPARSKLKEKYGTRLEELYSTLEERARAKRERVMRGDGGVTLEEKLCAAIEMVLGIDSASLGGASSFLQLGGDSLSAVRLVDLVEKVIGGVRLPVAEVLNPAASIDHLCTLVVKLKHEEEKRGCTRSPHQEDIIKASDLTLDNFFPPEIIRAAKTIYKQHLPATAKHVLLTGANGFLGRFLALQLLERVEGQVFCLVRAQSEQQAYERMMEAYDTPDGKLRKVVKGYGSRLKVLNGKISGQGLGYDWYCC